MTPTSLRYLTCDVFTDRRFGGNPLAVFPDGRGLDTARMQAIAREFNLSETTFVLPPDDPRHAARVRIFTPVAEMPFAGHPTIGTAYVLATIGAASAAGGQIVFEEGVGPVPVQIERRDGTALGCTFTAARAPELGPPAPAAGALAAVLSLASEDLSTYAGCWSCGLPFLVVPLRDVAALERCRIDSAQLARVLAGYATQQIYPIARVDDATWRVRMFAPTLGVSEDPATGSAAAALAGWLARHGAPGIAQATLLQGQEIGRPSTLRLQFERNAAGAATRVRVGGGAVIMSEGTLYL